MVNMAEMMYLKVLLLSSSSIPVFRSINGSAISYKTVKHTKIVMIEKNIKFKRTGTLRIN